MSEVPSAVEAIATAKRDLEEALLRCVRYARKCAAWDEEAKRLTRGVELALVRVEAVADRAEAVLDAEVVQA
jgi:hypothetical protein